MEVGELWNDGRTGIIQMQRRSEGTLSGTVTKAAGPIFSCQFSYSLLKLTLSNCRYPELNADFYKTRDRLPL
ncbi:hypothetical protein AJ88_22965 [Mesorhizobium amorphae CCBAU 01583]|nr:hypothetical protein AJ88_22965 [Mesorhizobium amorphae CCBAU 01583]